MFFEDPSGYKVENGLKRVKSGLGKNVSQILQWSR